VDEVASGFRSTFHNPEELLMILMRETPKGERQPAGATVGSVTAAEIQTNSRSSAP
jgi:hypothetical protein